MNYITIIIGSILLAGIALIPANAQIVDTTASISLTTTIITKEEGIISWMPDEIEKELGIESTSDKGIILKNGLDINNIRTFKQDNNIVIEANLKDNSYEMLRNLMTLYSTEDIALTNGIFTLRIDQDTIETQDDLEQIVINEILEKWSKAEPVNYGGTPRTKDIILEKDLI